MARAASSSAATQVADLLASAYLTLRKAAAIAGHLIADSPGHLGLAGWDVEINIHAAVTAIENAVGVHDLATFHPFWASPELRIAITTTHATVALIPNARRTVDTLIGDLATALTTLAAAEEHADTLVTSDHCYANHHGYVGGLGWDLQTAVDDALIAVRTAIYATALAETTPGEALR